MTYEYIYGIFILMINTRFDIVTVEIFTSYSNKHYCAGYWILALYKYIIIILKRDLSVDNDYMFIWLQTTQHTNGEAFYKLFRTFPPPTMGARFTVMGKGGHADPLDSWRCYSQRRVMWKPLSRSDNASAGFCDICYDKIHVMK